MCVLPFDNVVLIRKTAKKKKRPQKRLDVFWPLRPFLQENCNCQKTNCVWCNFAHGIKDKCEFAKTHFAPVWLGLLDPFTLGAERLAEGMGAQTLHSAANETVHTSKGTSKELLEHLCFAQFRIERHIWVWAQRPFFWIRGCLVWESNNSEGSVYRCQCVKLPTYWSWFNCGWKR